MNPEQLELVAEIVSAYVSNNSVPAASLPGLIADISRSLATLGAPTTAEPEPAPLPAVNPKKSVFPDYLLSLEDGKQYRTLKRHLGGLGMTPQEYREKWGLPRDYPMVAQSYSAQRSELAKSRGLGRKRKPAEDPAPAEPASKAPAKTRKPRAKKASADAAAG